MADAAEEPPAAEEPAPQADPEAAEEPAEEPTESEAAAAVLQSAAPKSPRMLAQQSSNLGEKGAALNSTVQLNPEDGDVQEQLRQILIDNAVRVIDLFRDWDDDGDGKVRKKEPNPSPSPNPNPNPNPRPMDSILAPTLTLTPTR